jgi:molecular chaperone DnaK (HSP70)
MEEAAPVVIPNRWGNTVTPSAVAWTPAGWLVGEDAVRAEMSQPEQTWWDIKRKVGTSWRAKCGSEELHAERLLVPLISQLREDAEAFLHAFISACVLAVPACFTLAQRAGVARAAKMAGLDQVRIINEPTAAALAFNPQEIGNHRFLVVDFGAGTVDISAVESDGSVWQVLDSIGASDVGGYDFDIFLTDWLIERLGREGFDHNSATWRTLRKEAENIKIALSSVHSYEWRPLPIEGKPFPPLLIQREDLDRLIRFPIRRVIHLVHSMWEKYVPEHLLLVGGSGRIPLLRNLLEQEVARPEQLSLCAEESIVIGAALHSTSREERLLIDVLSQDIGILEENIFIPVIKRGTPIPTQARTIISPKVPGTLRLPVFQGEMGHELKGTVITTLELSHVVPGEEIVFKCFLDSSGMLRLSLVRGNGALFTVPPLALSDEHRQDNPRMGLRELEIALARISPLLTDSQEDLIANMFTQVTALGKDNAEAVEILETMLKELESGLDKTQEKTD